MRKGYAIFKIHIYITGKELSLLAKITQERDYISSLSQIESEHNRLTKELTCYSGREGTLSCKLYYHKSIFNSSFNL